MAAAGHGGGVDGCHMVRLFLFPKALPKTDGGNSVESADVLTGSRPDRAVGISVSDGLSAQRAPLETAARDPFLIPVAPPPPVVIQAAAPPPVLAAPVMPAEPPMRMSLPVVCRHPMAPNGCTGSVERWPSGVARARQGLEQWLPRRAYERRHGRVAQSADPSCDPVATAAGASVRNPIIYSWEQAAARWWRGSGLCGDAAADGLLSAVDPRRSCSRNCEAVNSKRPSTRLRMAPNATLTARCCVLAF